jgi:predicted DNA-binding transcriptional regulator YafY
MPSREVTALIERAIRDRMVLGVTYRASDATVATYDVEPLAIRFNRSGHRVLWCWRCDAGHIEELLWDAIEAAVDTGGTFAPRPWEEPHAT